MKAYNYFIIS